MKPANKSMNAKILAIDTATERCSVALRLGEGACIERAVDTARAHAEIVLPMVEEVLREAGVTLGELDAIAYGRGPGAFTGVRIAIGVVQGLAYGTSLPTIGVSDLAAVAQQVARQVSKAGEKILVCMDARMSEVYWGVFEVGDDGLVFPASEERVSKPALIEAQATRAAGTAFGAYPELRAKFANVPIHEGWLPHAREIAALAEPAYRAGRGEPATQARPVYLRDQVTFVKGA